MVIGVLYTLKDSTPERGRLEYRSCRRQRASVIRPQHERWHLDRVERYGVEAISAFAAGGDGLAVDPNDVTHIIVGDRAGRLAA
jgi:hypothetical protein